MISHPESTDKKSDNARPIGFSIEFLHPRYFLTWLMIALLRLLYWLPRRWVLALGASLGQQFGRRNIKRRRIAEINLELCFPELDRKQREQLMNRHFQLYGQNMLDLGLSRWVSQARLTRLVTISGDTESLDYVGRDRVIFVTPHVIGMDLGGQRLFLEQPGISMMKRDKNPLISWFLWRGRKHLADAVIVMRDQGLRQVVRTLRNERFCYFIPDEDFGVGKHAVFAPFFGLQTSTLTTVSRLAHLTQAVVVPCMCALDPHTGNYNLELAPLLEDFPSADMVRDAGAINQAFEALIRKKPEQYLWTQRWFKTRPDGAPSPYPKV